MHSRRMHLAGRGCLHRWGVFPGGGCLPGDVCPGECLPWGCLPGDVCIGGVSSQGGVCPMACWDTPPLWTEFFAHACKNITFLQLLLRAVIIVDQNKSISNATCIEQNGERTFLGSLITICLNGVNASMQNKESWEVYTIMLRVNV